MRLTKADMPLLFAKAALAELAEQLPKSLDRDVETEMDRLIDAGEDQWRAWEYTQGYREAAAFLAIVEQGEASDDVDEVRALFPVAQAALLAAFNWAKIVEDYKKKVPKPKARHALRAEAMRRADEYLRADPTMTPERLGVLVAADLASRRDEWEGRVPAGTKVPHQGTVTRWINENIIAQR